MKYFCPLENVKTISGRNSSISNGINAESTNINGWEIAANGIWAGGKDSNAVGTGKNNLGIFSQNWSIGSDGNIIANNGTFKNIYALENNFFIEKRSGTYSLNVIHLDNFELIKNNTLNKLTLFGKNTQNPNESQEIATIKEDGNYFELDFEQGCCTPCLRFSNPQINKDKYPSIGTNTYGYLNLNNNLTLTASSDYFFDEHSISRSNVGSNISYKYTLPDKSGEVAIIKEEDPQYYSYSIEIEEGFYLGSSVGDHYTASKISFEINTLTMITNETNKTFTYSMDEEINGKLKLYQIRIQYTSNKTINKISFSISYPTHPDLNTAISREQNQWNKFIVYRHDIFGRKTKFIYNVTTGKWGKTSII